MGDLQEYLKTIRDIPVDAYIVSDPAVMQLLREEIGEKLGRHAVLQVSSETTLAGSAAAALLNT